MLYGVFTQDPHPGNVLIDVRADAAVPVLLDWGMHQHLEDSQRLGVAGIVDAVVRGAHRASARAPSTPPTRS